MSVSECLGCSSTVRELSGPLASGPGLLLLESRIQYVKMSGPIPFARAVPQEGTVISQKRCFCPWTSESAMPNAGCAYASSKTRVTHLLGRRPSLRQAGLLGADWPALWPGMAHLNSMSMFTPA